MPDLHKLSIEERLELLITVAQGVQHAHQKGIIHRDLKPSNIHEGMAATVEGGATRRYRTPGQLVA